MLTLLLTMALGSVPAPPDSAVLRLDNREIMVFRAPLGAMSPSERVSLAERWISVALAGGTDSVAAEPVPEGYVVSVGNRKVFTVTPGDVDTLAGTTLEEHAAIAAWELSTAMREFREARSLSGVLEALGASLLATAIYALLLILIHQGRRLILRRLGARVRVAARRAPILGVPFLSYEMMKETGRFLTSAAVWLVDLAAGYAYLTFVLTRFALTRPLGERLGGYITSTIERLCMGALHSIPNLITVLLIFLGTRFLVRIVSIIFAAAERGRLTLPWVHPETAVPTRRITIVVLWLFGLVMAYPYLPGSGSAAFKGISVFSGLLLTLGSTGPMGQAISGLVLMYARSFKIGDVVEVSGNQGVVVRMGVVSTQIRTPKNEYITVPNSVMITGSVTNFSRGREQEVPLIIYSSVTIGYDAPWRQIHELLIEAGRKLPEALSDPAPWVLQRVLNDWHVEYQLNVAIDPKHAERMPDLYGRLHGNIQDSFAAAGVEIMSPSYFALRDGNAVALPPEQRPAGRAKAHRVDLNPD